MSVALLAYILDRLFSEFSFIRHPVQIFGDFIMWFEKLFYKDSVLIGTILLLVSLLIFGSVAFLIETLLSMLNSFIEIAILGFLSSMFLAHTMLYQSVLNVADSNEPQREVAMIVSRDTKELSESESYKAAIESYAENLSDGVIAPLFYLLAFGFSGIVAYKVINTLDSMVGYKTKRYINFGKVSALTDDVVNFIPSRITAFLIALLTFKRRSFRYSHFAKGHESPNAGYPISAMALYLGVSLGGATSYFGKIKEKPYFGDGRKVINKYDVLKALDLRNSVDVFIIILLIFGSIYGV